MLTIQELETYTKPLCSREQYEKKLANFRRAKESFAARESCCSALPCHLHVEASGCCNLSCRLCPRGGGQIARTGHLSFAVFQEVFLKISPTLVSLAISGWGEPLLNPHTSEMIDKAVSHSVPVTLNTNGIVLAEKSRELVGAKLTVINVSLDGMVSTKTHEYSETSPFAAVVRGVQTLRKEKANRSSRYPIIHGQFLLNEDSIEEIEDLRNQALTLGIEHIRFKRRHETMPGQVAINNRRPAEDLKKIWNHKLVQPTENVRFTPLACAHPWESVFLSCEGNLGICSWDAFHRLNLGSGRDLESAWNGEVYRRIRRWHSGTASIREPCSRCNRMPGYLLREDAVPFLQERLS